MNFQTTIDAVAICLQTGTPVLVVGLPGEAKTRIIEAILKETTVDSHTSIVALHEPTDYAGYAVPLQEEGVVKLLPTSWAKRLASHNPENGSTPNPKPVGLYLDELSNGAPATRSAAMRGILDGTWGEQHIAHLSTAAAMNPPDIAESGYDLSAPLANRFCHIQWDMPVEYWIEAMVSGFPAPKFVKVPNTWRSKVVSAQGTVAGFANARSAIFKGMPQQAAARSGPWPSFRTWTMALDLLAACMSLRLRLNDDVVIKLIAGCVGDGAAQEFCTFAYELDLPDPEDVLAHPERLKLPDRGDRAYAVLTAVVAAVLANMTIERWERAWKVLEVACNQNKIDIAAQSARSLAHHRPKDSSGSFVKPPKEINPFIPALKAAGLISE